MKMVGSRFPCEDRSSLHCVPPSPDVLAMLHMDYRRSSQFKRKSFADYLRSVGYIDPAEDTVGMDDSVMFRATAAGPELIDIPSQPVTGVVRVKVLLVDFPDRVGQILPKHYEDMLFSDGIYPTGSMRDYYKEVSLGKVKIAGSVHGWLRMPQLYSYYTNGESGIKRASYPHNAQRLAEDAVKEALAQNVPFESSLDKFNLDIVTALFIVHAGRGAEVMPPSQRGREIWSHKWDFRTAVNVGPNLDATIYLTVPADCKVGVCAHELGHLAFQWQDFYDPNYETNGEWDGSGTWDLMAGGSYNGSGARPAHPACLHKMQHGWIPSTRVVKSRSITIKPYSPTYGRAYKIVSPAFGPKRYLLLENRKRVGFDASLNGEGLLVWRVDEDGLQEALDTAGLSLIQADGKNNLNDPDDWNQGDAGDPFPGSSQRHSLLDTGAISTSFSDQRSGIELNDIDVDVNGTVRLNVKFKPVAPTPAPSSTPASASKRGITKPSAKPVAKKTQAKPGGRKASAKKSSLAI